MRLILAILLWTLRAAFSSRSDLVLENLALRQQLATFGRAKTRPMLKPEERAFWVALSKAWSGWRSCLLVVIRHGDRLASSRRLSCSWVDQPEPCLGMPG